MRVFGVALIALIVGGILSPNANAPHVDYSAADTISINYPCVRIEICDRQPM